MAALRFIPLEEAARRVSDRLATAVHAELGDAAHQVDTTVLVTRKLTGCTVARIRDELCQAGISAARALLVFGAADAAALRGVLLSGIGDAIEESACTANAIAARLGRWAEIDAALAQPLVRDNLVGASAAWLMTLRSVAESALFSSAPVLLTGATGTGKELLARMLHSLDARARKRDLMIVDCTTLSRELAGSELFGHERGAFTGASGEREGAIACADGGTLFLDEVGELPLELQAQLLRVLQEKTYRRVGSTTWRRAEFRLVCATNRTLPDEVAAGRFRSDLYHRIAAITCRTPSLAERRADIALLARHFAGASATLSSPLIEYLRTRPYPGNVRELYQLLQACLRRHAGIGPLCLSSLPDEEIRRWRAEEVLEPATDGWDRPVIDDFVRKALAAKVGLKELGREVESAAVRIVLEESESITAAALRLGVTPRALHLRRAAERD